MEAAFSAPPQGTTLQMIAFHLGNQQFSVKTASILEIRKWTPVTPLPHSHRHHQSSRYRYLDRGTDSPA